MRSRTRLRSIYRRAQTSLRPAQGRTLRHANKREQKTLQQRPARPDVISDELVNKEDEMDLETLEKLFLWTMVVNTGVYALTGVASILMRGFIYNVHRKLYDMDEKTVDKSVQSYLANYKLLITVFNFAPWVAILIIK